MDIGKELRVIEVDEPATAPAPLEVEAVLAEDVEGEPAETGMTTG